DNKTKEDSDTSSDSNDDVDNDLDDENDTGDVNSNTEDNDGAGKTGKGLPSESQLNNAVSEWTRMQKKLAPSKRKITDFNTSSVVYDAKTGQYYYGMNKGLKLSGDELNPTLSKILPNKSLNEYKLGNCAEVDAINQALNNKANLSDLHIYTIVATTNKLRIPSNTFGSPKIACENCTYTFYGQVSDIISGWMK
ncbi:MAG: YwqJ-related putative deaminase, partial [Clostridiales bacterium]